MHKAQVANVKQTNSTTTKHKTKHAQINIQQGNLRDNMQEKTQSNQSRCKHTNQIKCHKPEEKQHHPCIFSWSSSAWEKRKKQECKAKLSVKRTWLSSTHMAVVMRLHHTDTQHDSTILTPAIAEVADATNQVWYLCRQDGGLVGDRFARSSLEMATFKT